MVKKFAEYMEEVKNSLNYRGIEPNVKKKTRLNVSNWWSETTKDRDPEKSKKTKELERKLDEL